jgi:hypothetical protein
MFGTNTNQPFLFNAPAPPPSSAYPWQPPSNFSPQKAFPQPQVEEVNDVDMRDANGLASPERQGKMSADGGGRGEKASGSARTMALGGLRRVFKSRQRQREREEYSNASESGSEDEAVVGGKRSGKKDGRKKTATRTQSLSNHYTINMPAAPAPVSDLPNTLLGCVAFRLSRQVK